MRGTFWVSLTLLVALSTSAAEFLVVSTSDRGEPGTLRWAIEQANRTPDDDKIVFVFVRFFDGPPPRITLTRPLPEILHNVSIYTDFFPTSVVIDSSRVNGDGLVIAGSSVEVWDVVVTGARGNGFVMNGSHVTLFGCEARNNRGTGFLINGDQNSVRESVASGNHEGIVVTTTGTFNQIGHWDPPCDGQPFCPPRERANTVSENALIGIRVDGTINMVSNAEVSGNGIDGIRINGRHNLLEHIVTSSNGGSGLRLFKPARVSDLTGTCNRTLLIDSGPAGPTPNDVLEHDAIQNAPELHHVIADETLLSTTGVLRSLPNRQYEIAVYGFDGTCGIDRESRIINTFTVKTDDNGEAWFRKAHPRFGDAVALSSRPFHALIDPPELVPSELSETVRAEHNRVYLADLAVTTTAEQSATKVTFRIAVTNHGPAAVPWLAVTIPSTSPARIIDARDFELCRRDGTCWLTNVAAGDSRIIEQDFRTDTPQIVHRASVGKHPLFETPPDPDVSNNVAEIVVTPSR